MRPGAGAGVVLALITTLCGGACTGDPDAPPPVRDAIAALSASELRDAAVELVEEREAALVAGDREAFLATVDEDELQLVATQRRWFDNLALMPVGDLRLEPAAGARVADAGAEDGEVRLAVDFTMRLEGYEQHSVTERLTYRFRQVEEGVRLVDDRDDARDRRAGWLPDPWDVGDVVVRESGSILAFFDEETEPYADSVMKDLETSQETVLAALPDWSGQVVAYDISDLTGLEERTPMALWETGGVAYPVPVRPGSTEVAAYRFVVNPEVAHNSLKRGFLLRHELAHLALAGRDDASPRWLVEGAAEYVSRTHYSPARRRLLAAYDLAYVDTAEPVLADVDTFYAQPDLNYALAATACSYLAAIHGPQRLWDLMDAFAAERARPGRTGSLSPAQADAVLVREIGLDNAGLARTAVAWAAGAL